MFLKKLRFIFLSITLIGSIFLIYSWYDIYNFKKTPLPQEIVNQVKQKQLYLEGLAYRRFGITRKIPVIISNNMPSNLFGLATLDNEKKIIVFLNKKRFKESTDYMINDVLPHEYAHAIMFAKGNITNENGGHTLIWQRICQALEGLKCDRYVDNKDILIGKTNFF